MDYGQEEIVQSRERGLIGNGPQSGARVSVIPPTISQRNWKAHCERHIPIRDIQNVEANAFRRLAWNFASNLAAPKGTGKQSQADFNFGSYTFMNTLMATYHTFTSSLRLMKYLFCTTLQSETPESEFTRPRQSMPRVKPVSSAMPCASLQSLPASQKR